MDDEAELEAQIRRAKQGDREALEETIRGAAARMAKLIEGRLGPTLRRQLNPSDVFQSACLTIIRDFEQFAGDDSDDFIRWVGGVIENNIRMKARFLRAERRDVRREKQPDSGDWMTEQGGPASVVGDVEELLLVGRALDVIRADYREVILLRTLDGLSHEEIGRRLGKSPAATRVLLSRARAALSLRLEADGRP